MKKFNVLILLSIILLGACRGPEGPPGPQGPEGPEGPPGPEGFIFEIEFDFEGPEYAILWEFPSDFETFDTDVVHVYFLIDQFESGGDLIDVWRPLPITLFTNNALVQYTYNFSLFDVEIALEASTDPSNLDPVFRNDWIARIVLIPAFFAAEMEEQGISIDWDDYHSVEQALQVKDPIRLNDVEDLRANYPSRSHLEKNSESVEP